MADLSDSHQEGVSLFPMFNILACTLGVMVFILATVATVSLGAGKAVEILPGVAPGADAPTQRPTWMEWDGRELVMHPSRDVVRFDQDLHYIPTWDSTYAYMSNVIAGTAVGRKVSEISLDPANQYVILLVRPSGFQNFPEVRGFFENLGIDIGYEPVNQLWRDVSVIQ
jgi:hypothetical protein